MAEHTYMLRQNLADIESYAGGMLADLERGAGELPQWTNHIISTVRTHMHDVVHFLRHQSREGRRYGYSHRVGPGTRPPAQMEFSTDPNKHLGRMYGTSRGEASPWYGRAGVETTSKRFYGQPKRRETITVTGSRIRRYGVPGRPFGTPGWYGQGGVATVDSGFLEGSRRYAATQQSASMARKNLREIAEYAREAAGYLEHGAGIPPAWLEHKLSISAGHMDGMGHWLDNEGIEGRKYGRPGGRRGGGRGRPGGPGGPGGFPGGPGHVPNPMRRGRFWRKHPHRHVPYHPVWGYVPWMYPGNGIAPSGLQADIWLGEPPPVPNVSKVYAREADGKFILGMRGSGFSAIDEDFLVILFRMGDGDYQQAQVPARVMIDDQIEVELPLSQKNAPEFILSDIGFVDGGEIFSLSHSFFQLVPRPYTPFGLRKYGLNVLQKFDGPSGPLRPNSQALGIRRYAMTPGEMVESEGPMGYLQRPWRNLRPGYGPVQEYGSMGYGSMGTGSMDQAVQQAMLQRTRGSKVP